MQFSEGAGSSFDSIHNLIVGAIAATASPAWEGGAVPEVVARMIEDEIELTLSAGVVDSDRIKRIAERHYLLGTSIAQLAPVYATLRDHAEKRLGGTELQLIVQHEQAMVLAHLETTLSRFQFRESLQRAVVNLANSFDELLSFPEDAVFDKLVGMIQEISRVPLVFVATIDGTISTGFSGPVLVQAYCGPASGYVASLELSADPGSPSGRGLVGQALRSGQPQLSSTFALPEFDQWRSRLDQYGLCFAAVVPFEISINRSAVLVLYRGAGDPVTPDLIDPLVAMAREISRLFRARLLTEQEKRRLAVSEAKASLVSCDATTLVEIMDWVSKRLLESGVTSSGAMLVAIADRTSLRCVRFWGEEAFESDVLKLEIPLSGASALASPVATAFHLQEEMVTNGLGRINPANQGIANALVELTAGRVLARFPLVVRGTTHGVYVAMFVDYAGMGASDLLISDVKELVGTAMTRLERNVAEAESRWLGDLSRTLLDSSGVIFEAGSSQSLLKSICDAIIANGVFGGAWVALGDPETGSVIPVALAGASPSELSELHAAIESCGPGPFSLQGVRNGVVSWSDDSWADPRFREWREFLLANGYRSAVALPIHDAGAVRGAIVVVANEPGVFIPPVISILATVARMASQGLTDFMLKQRLSEERNHQSIAARTDVLTGLANRIAFEEVTVKWLEAGRAVALGVLDLDGFKELNDSLGHSAGDAFLKRLGGALGGMGSDVVTVARLGGDEFGFCIDRNCEESPAGFAARVMSSIAEMGVEFAITCSLGWALAPEDSDSYQSLLVHADEALYAAKAAGKARSFFFGGQVAARTASRKLIREQLPADLADSKVPFALQPKIDARTGALKGVEMLLRWPIASLGVLGAELRADAGLAREVGIYAIENARIIGDEFNRSGFGSLGISFNITPSHFLSPHFRDDVKPLLDASDSQRFTVEITEDVALGDLHLARTAVADLRSVGLRVSLDDFGTGYASLANVATLEVDEIKVDRSFISRFRNDLNAFAVVSSLTILAGLAGLEVIAEGVETGEELDAWMRLGGRMVQGYLYSRPVPIEEIFAQLRPGRFPRRNTIPFPLNDFVLVSRAIIDSHLNPSKLYRGAACPLGDWFAKRGSRWGGLESFRIAIELHQRIHDTHSVLLGPEFVDVIESMVAAIDWELTVNGVPGEED